MVSTFSLPAVLRYLVILAIDTLQIAIGKKDVTDTHRTTDDGFLSFVNADRCNIVGGFTPAVPDMP
jgi:hypothetical protein